MTLKSTDHQTSDDSQRRPLLRRYPSVGLCLALALLVGVVFGPSILRGEIPWFMDTVGQFFPARVHAARLLGQGELPLWNRTVYGGTAFLANPQWGLMYPGHWPFFLLPTGHVYTLINAGHILLMALGLFFWLRRVLGRPGIGAAALTGGLGILGGWTMAHLAFGAYLQVAAWFPWMLWAWTCHADARLEDHKSARPLAWGAVAGLFGAMQWLAGAPQLALYCLAGLWFYALVHGVVILRKRAPLVLLQFLLPQVVLTLGLSAPQWMATRAFLEECNRSGALPLDRVLSGALDYKGLLRAWIGGTGSPENAEQILYPGLVSLFLAAVGLVGLPFQKRAGHSLLPFRLSIGLLLLVSTLSCYRPVARALYHILPLYSHFHDPMRALFLAYIATIALAALGFQELWRVTRNVAQRHAQALFDAGLLALALAALVDVSEFSKDHIDTKTVRVPQAHEDTADPLQQAFSDTEFSGENQPLRFLAVDHGIQYTYNYTRSDFFFSYLPGLSLLSGLEDIQGYDPAIPWRYAFFVRLANSLPTPTATLYPSHFGIFRNLDSPWLERFGPLAAVGPAKHHFPLQSATWIPPGQSMRIDLRRQGRPWDPTRENLADVRVYMAYVRDTQSAASSDRLEFRFLTATDERLANLEAEGLENPRDVLDYGWLWPDVLPPQRWGRVPEHLEVLPAHPARITEATLDKEVDAPVVFIEIHNPHDELAALFYSIGLPDDSIPFVKVGEPDIYFSSFSGGFPSRVQTVRSEATLPDGTPPGGETIEAYRQQAARYQPDVTHIEVPSEDRRVANSRMIKNFTLGTLEANRLVVHVDKTEQAGWLVVPEPYQRGWTCKVNGEEHPIYPADVLFRAVFIEDPAGSEVVFTYWPPALTTGLITAIIAFVLGALCFLHRNTKASKSDAN
ncbi:MAG: YfhO family protein [Candidatus Sumerlaeota bacterium]